MKNTILSTIRHLLTFVGGAVVANNPGIAPETMETGIGLAIGLAGLIWGAHDEYKAERAIRKPLN